MVKVDGKEVGLYVVGGADGAGDDVRGELIEASRLGMSSILMVPARTSSLTVGVVDGDLHAGAVLEEVTAAVAHIADQDLAALDGCAHQSGAHALVLGGSDRSGQRRRWRRGWREKDGAGSGCQRVGWRRW